MNAQSGAAIEASTSSVTDALRLFDALHVISRVAGAAKVPRLRDYLHAQPRAAVARARAGRTVPPATPSYSPPPPCAHPPPLPCVWLHVVPPNHLCLPLHAGSPTSARVIAWLRAFPLASNSWQGVWEVVPVWASPTDDPSCHTAIDAASYLLDAADLRCGPVAATLAAVRNIVDWVVDVFVFQYASSSEPAVQWGAYAVCEQAYDRSTMALHTLHFTAVAARLANATKNATLHELVERSVAWSTYVLQDDNQTLIGPVDQSNWLGAGLRLPKYTIATVASMLSARNPRPHRALVGPCDGSGLPG